MKHHIGQLSRKTRAAIICAVGVAVAGGAAGAWKIHQRPAALPHASCGSAVTHFVTARTQLLSSDRGALTCFVKAARECRPGSLRVTEMGVDTGTDFVFTVEQGTTPCQVTEQRQYYSANFGGSQSAVTSVQCRRAAVSSSRVLLRCAGLDVLIPAAVSAPSPGVS